MNRLFAMLTLAFCTMLAAAPDNAKIMSNVALYLVASGQGARAQGSMTQQKLAPELQQAVRGDAQRIGEAVLPRAVKDDERAHVASR